MGKFIVKLITFTIVIGITGLALNTILGNNTVVYLEKMNMYYGTNSHFWMYKFNFYDYIKNIELAATNVSILKFELPDTNWVPIENLENLGHDLVIMLNYVVLIINIILYPIRIIAYVINNLIAILGINQNTNDPNNGLAWLVTFVREILARFQIPYATPY